MTDAERAPEKSAWRANRVRRALLLSATLGLSIAAVPSLARADDTAARGLAEQMFSEGRKLMQEGKFDEACPKLAESQRLDPGGGTILNLAVCHESQGRFASAWSEFKEALALARTDNRRDREQLAMDHLAQVEPKVSHLTFSVDPKAVVHGLAVKLDGEGIGQAAWGSPLPVDPGTHEIVASAPGKLERRLSVQIGALSDSKSISIVPLDDAPADARASVEGGATTDVANPEPQMGKRAAGIVVGAVGLAGIVVGTVFGVEALQRKHDSDATCTGSNCTSQAGVDFNDDAKRFATFSDIGLGVGIVGLLVGTYLIVTSGPQSTPVRASTALRVNVTPSVGAGSSGLQISGTW